MATTLQDSFTDTDGVRLDAHTGELGATWTPVSTFGGTLKPAVFANRMRGADAGDSFWMASGIADADGESTTINLFRHDGAAVAVGCLIRANSTSNSYYWAFWHSGGLFRIYKTIGAGNAGVGVNVASTTIAMPAGAFSLKLKATGTGATVLVELFINSNVTADLSYSDVAADRLTVPGKSGLYFGEASGGTTGVHVDSITMSTAAASSTLSFTTPVAGRIHQRVGSTGTVKASGSYTGTPTSIEARLVADGTNTPITGFDWSVKVATPTGGAFTFTFPTAPMDVWFNVQMRDSAIPGTVYTSGKTGVGRLYASIGQSNARDFMYFGSNTLVPDARTRAHGYIVKEPAGAGPLQTWVSPNPADAEGAITFSNALAVAHNGLVGYLDLAVSGTGLGTDWLPSSATSYARFRDAVLALEGKIEGAFWIQGENDANSGVTEATYYANLGTLFSNIRTDFGQPTLPIVLVTLHAIPLANYATDANMQAIRRAQVSKCADANVYRVDRIDVPVGADNIHHSTAGFATLGARVAHVFKFIAGLSTFYRGPSISSVVKVNPTTFDINLLHSGGTDFTPISAITGIRALDGATPVAVSSAARQTATAVRVVLASAPAALPTIQNLFGVTPDYSGVVKDNSALALPLEWNNGVVATEGSATSTGSANLTEASNTLTATATVVVSGSVTATANITLGSCTVVGVGTASVNTLEIPSNIVSSGRLLTPAVRLLEATGSTLRFIRGSQQELLLYNTGASAVTVTIRGSEATSISVRGAIGQAFEVSTGFVIMVPAYQFVVAKMDPAYEYLIGNINITASVAGVLSVALFSAF